MNFVIIFLFFAATFAIILFIITFAISKGRKKKEMSKIKKLNTENKMFAIDELRKMIKKDPYNFYARDKLADLLIQKRSYLAAIKEYLIILDHSQSNEKIDETIFFIKIGKAYRKLENINEAKKYFLMAKKKDDINVDVNKYLAEIELLQGNYDKAEIFYNIAIQLDTEDLELIKNYAKCLFNLNKFKFAAENFGKVLKERSTDNESLYYYAISLYKLNHFDQSLRYFIQLKKDKQFAAEVFFLIGNIRKNQKMYVQAIEEYNNALSSEKAKKPEEIAELHYLLADCYFKTHNLPKALEHWKKVAEIDPTYKGVDEKIETFSEISSNQLLEMYLVGSVNQFTRICKLFIKYYTKNHSTLKGNVKFLESKTNSDGSLQILTEVTSSNYIEQNFFLFIRSTTVIGDMTVRNLYNTIKEQKADKGVCVTAGSFSDSAKSFVESRMLKCFERNQLVEILNKLSKHLQQQ